MRLIRYSFALLVLSIFSGAVSGQGLKIVPRKTVYKRANVGREGWKEKFEVTVPVVESKLSQHVRRRVAQNLDYWRAFSSTDVKFSLADELSGTDRWVDALTYDVLYNANNILNVRLMMEGSGAYPDAGLRYVTIDARTGKKLELYDLLRYDSADKLRDAIRDEMRSTEDGLDADEKEGLREQRSDAGYRKFHPGPNGLELRHLSGFAISDKGVSFMFDYAYPHVSQALEPSGEFFIPYKRLSPYIRRDGLLARFIR